MTRAEILALPAGRELDMLVAEKVLGFQRGGLGGDDPDYWWCNPGYLNATPHSLRVARTPRFSTDIAAAWQVVGKLCPSTNRAEPWFKLYTSSGSWMANFHRESTEDTAADTAPLAVCRAALLAMLPEHPQL